jgi:hypothetical protein
VLLPTQTLGNATTETQFQGAIPAKGLAGGPLALPLKRTGQLSNRHIRFKAVGRVLPGVTGTFEIRIYISSVTAANLIIDTGPITVSTNTSFLILCDCVWDQSSNSFNGVLYGQVGDTALGIAGLNNSVISVTIGSSTAVSSSSAETALITGQFGSSSAGNNAFVDEFDLDAL